MSPDGRLLSTGGTPDEAEVIGVLADQIKDFAAEHLDAAAIDRAHHIPEGVVPEMADMGLFGLSIPEAYGGAGFSLQGVCGVVSELARYDRSVATTLGLHLGLGTRGVVAFADEAMKERYLPPLAEASLLAAFAATEPSAGSDLQGIRTVGQVTDGALKLSGSKIFVTNGGLADVFTLLVSTPGLGGMRRGASLVLVEKGDEGVVVGAEEVKLGLRGSSTTSLHLDDVEISPDRIVGEPGQGMPEVAHVLAWGRTAMSAGCVGAARVAYDKTLAHVRVRKQFGKTLDQFDVVRHQLMHMGARLYAMEALVRYTGVAADTDDALLMQRSTSAKVFCSEGDWALCDLGVQLHGGSGFIDETGMPLLLRDARVTRIFEGANDVLCIHAGSMEATRPAAGRLPLHESLGTACARRADLLAANIADWRAEKARVHRVRLLRKQDLLHRLGRMVVLRDATDAVVRRACAEGSGRSEDLVSYWLDLAEAELDGLIRPLPSLPTILPLLGAHA